MGEQLLQGEERRGNRGAVETGVNSPPHHNFAFPLSSHSVLAFLCALSLPAIMLWVAGNRKAALTWHAWKFLYRDGEEQHLLQGAQTT